MSLCSTRTRKAVSHVSVERDVAESPDVADVGDGVELRDGEVEA